MNTQQKILFIDRDGTLIAEPADEQVDSLEKLAFMPNVISALSQFKKAGFALVMISNQDGLGTESFPEKDFALPHDVMLRTFASQNIIFDDIRICQHFSAQNCDCRKPKIGLLMDYVTQQRINLENSWVIGDRQSDLDLAKNLGIKAIHFGSLQTPDWEAVANFILQQPRIATVTRNTKETALQATINLDMQAPIAIETGLGFFNHMLEQLAKHGGFSLSISGKGDLHIDDHHMVEDTAIVLGDTMRMALGDKIGIGRYGYLLPMDEALAQVAVDLSGRSYCVFSANFPRERVGDFSTELVEHFFHSFAESLKATLHISVQGKNTHHMIESVFKGVGRALRPALQKIGQELPSTKGIL